MLLQKGTMLQEVERIQISQEEYDLATGGKHAPSLKQVNMFYNACANKRYIAPELEQILALNGKELYNINSSLFDEEGYTTEKQAELIKNIVSRLQSAGVETGMPSDEALFFLPFEKGKMLIDTLLKLEKDKRDVLPATEGQLERIVKMRFCPAVDFSELGVSIKKALDKGQWRYKTSDELTNELKRTLKVDASRWLDKYSAEYAEWNSKRASRSKLDFIRTLEARLADVRNPQEVVVSIDLEGNIIETLVGEKESYVQAYSPLTEEQLLQFDDVSADQYIEVLQADLKRKYPSSLEGPARQKEESSLKDSLFALFAMAGYEDEEVLSSLNEKDNRFDNVVPLRNFIELGIKNDAFTEATIQDLGLDEVLQA